MVPMPSDSVMIASLISGAIISVGLFVLIGYIAKLYFSSKNSQRERKPRVPGSALGKMYLHPDAFEKEFSNIDKEDLSCHNKPPDKAVIME